MAKHDQRILKFLNQNADRAPTITEMMTRLNISISDISDSLGSLQAQGLISKRTNHQGIECWFPMGPQAAPQMAPPMQVPAPHLATRQMPAQPVPVAAAENRMPVERNGIDSRMESRMESRYGGGFSDRTVQAPDPQPPMPKAVPVQVQDIPAADSPVYGSAVAGSAVAGSAVAEAPADLGIIPARPEPALNASAVPGYGLMQPAPKSGIGFLTFALGLIAAVGVSTWLSGRLAGNEVNRAARNFVEKKALTEATAAFTDFQEKTKAHVTALEADVKKLTDELAASRAAADSLQALASTAKASAEKPKPAKRKARSRRR